MLKFLLNNQKGRFLIIGTLLMILGFFVEKINPQISNIVFYLSVFFLGYFVTKDAIESTIEERKPNVDLLMILAAIGAIAINYSSEGAMLLFIFFSADELENYVTKKSSNAISELLNYVPDKAKMINKNGQIVIVDTEDLKIGDKISISKGDQIPIDGVAFSKVVVNESSLTGESIPIEKEKGEMIYAGTINEGNSFVLEVTKLKKDTVFSNIIKMVSEAQSKPSKKEKIIDKIESKYVITVLVFVPLFILYLYFVNKFSFESAFYRGMVLLTVASPCALVASATPATLSAISNCAKNGVLFNKASAIESFRNIDVLLVDKTGTLTTGRFEVEEYSCPEDILKDVVYIEQNSNHPIAKSIVRKFSDVKTDMLNKNIPVEELDGIGLKMGNLIIGKASNFVGYKDPHQYMEKKRTGKTLSLIAKDNEIVGYILLSDQIREGVDVTVNKFRQNSVKVEMLTGDNEEVAKDVSEKLKLDNYFANCFPADKLNYIKEKQENGNIVGMVGDGINDAPALALADVGIAMGSGSSIAMESSDIVIVNSDLSKLLHSYEASKKLNKIIYSNILFSILVIIVLIILNLFGKLDLPSGVVFHETSTILVILNGLRMLKFKNN